MTAPTSGMRRVLAMSFAASGALVASCAPPCPEGVVGDSSATYSLVDGTWPGGDGAAEGLWQVSLEPAVSRTTCVDAREYEVETYLYTLELNTPSSGEGLYGRLLVDGLLLVDDGAFDEGIYTYESPSMVDEDRAGGAITWRILGSASLYADASAGQLIWTGAEQIRVLESQDPAIPAGCVFEYDVAGVKLCDE